MVAKLKAATSKAALKVKKGTKVGLKKGPRLTKAGQNFCGGGKCIATSVNGKACPRDVGEPGVVYCKECMRTGDPALKVVSHPLAGKCLVAARDLPKGYRVALWGHARRQKDMTSKAMEWGFDITGGWFLDPTKCKGSLVQFCPCAGPNEVAAITPVSGAHNRGGKYGSWPFVLGHKLKKNWQVTMQYGETPKDSDNFFLERGITRVDVGTKKNPAIRRKNAPRLGR